MKHTFALRWADNKELIGLTTVELSSKKAAESADLLEAVLFLRIDLDDCVCPELVEYRRVYRLTPHTATVRGMEENWHPFKRDLIDYLDISRGRTPEGAPK